MDGEQRRSDREVAGALGQLIAGVEDSKAGVATVDPDTELEPQETGQIEAELDESEDIEDALADDDEDSLDDDVDPSEADQQTYWTLVYEGKEYPVESEDEAKQLAQKGLHFGSQMNALTAEKREWEQQKAQVEAELLRERQEYAAALPVIRQQIEQAMGPEPDWVQLSSQVSAQEYNAIRAQWDQQRSRIDATYQEQQRMQQVLQQQHGQMHEQWVMREREATLESIPAWRDESAQRKAKDDIRLYLLGLGFTDTEVNQIEDHRFWGILNDAVKAREAVTVGQKEVKTKGTKAVAPGSGGKNTGRASRRRRQRERVRQGGGRVEDVAPLMSEIFESRERGR